MAITHINLSLNTAGGGRIHQILTSLENGQSLLVQELATFTTLLDGGDGTNVANFGAATTYYGFADNANAKLSWDELQSLNGKINSDATVSSVMTAMKQAANKHR